MSNLVLILITLMLAVFILYGIYEYYWKRRAIYKFASKLSGPETVFLFGNLLTFWKCKKQDILNVILNLMAPFSSPVRLWLGPVLVVYLKSAEHLQTVMQSPKIANKSFIYNFLKPFLREGLLTGSGKDHRRAKKEYQALFTSKMVEAYSYLLGKYAVKFVERLNCHQKGEKFEIISYFSNFTFESFLDILLETEEFDTKDVEIAKNLTKRGYELFFERLTTWWLHPDVIYKQTKAYKTQEKIINTLKLLIEKYIKEKILEIGQRIENPEAKENCTNKRAFSIIELFIEIRKGNLNSLLATNDIDHIVTLIAGNQDTQSSAMSFTCMLLGMFPKAQDKVYAELIEVLDGRRTVDLTDASKLKYLEMCIKEALRLFPSVPFIFRDTAEDFELESDLVIPANVTVMLSIFDVHRDPKHWEKPNDFYPEHFAPESVVNRHPFAFVPFSAGPRKCIAQKYAYACMKIMLATMLLNYVIESDEKFEDIRLKTDIMIRPVNGYFIKIRKR